ncbi:sensor histidine kinase [Deinococcus hopiensis]|uniref:histidine kinase n=1 Tax=Deinococcus hopiensis KR-140 TaxID=695939 RepID=A0A1W1VQ79_9DEIO|nr:ATP-binding protein [Deinococcus hopiensis]SMB95380.1 two-component system, OmpR family, sensor histidine kinase BaeS [Deinococcus hopiensis KR-140]
MSGFRGREPRERLRAQWQGALLPHNSRHRKFRSRAHRRRRGLRARLTRMFALVAILAVMLTTFLTVGTTFRVLAQVWPGVAAGGNSGASRQTRAAPWTIPGQDVAWERAAADAGHTIMRSAVQSALLSALLAAFVAAAVTRQLTRPLVRLAEGARQLQAGDRSVQLPVPRYHDELRELTLTFNDLTTSLARQEAWRRGLVADIAHDLRTPLSVMRSEIEAMQDGVQPVSDAALGRLHGEVLLLARLVTDLRTLSLAEGGALGLRLEWLEAAAVLETLAEAYALRAADVGVTLSVLAPQPVVSLHADPDRLRQALQNLLDNALRYAAPGTVELRAWTEEDAACLSVRDHGPGFGPDDLARAFERFYRADASRTRDPQGRASSGLGLAIARALAEAQGGQLTARNHPEGGAEFTLRFPSALTAKP